MDSLAIPLTLPRRITLDLMSLSKGIPTVPVQRRMNLKALSLARVEAGRPGWPSLFLKAYGAVAERMPELRRAYVALPWPHLVEYPISVASIAIERQYAGEQAVFFARIGNPAHQTLAEINTVIRDLAHEPLHAIKPFRKMLRLARLPAPVRRSLMWLGLNLARTRPWQFGTFGLTVYSSLGAESLHPISPLTTTLTYGVIGKNGRVNVRLIYDHRVFDGSTVARALCELEEELNGAILAEVRGMAKRSPLLLAA